MAAKLTFEARMDGLEKVLETLKKAEDQLTSVSQAGEQANRVMDRQVKDFSQQIEYLARTKSSVGGLFKQFTEQTQEASKILSSSHDVILRQFKAEISDYETNIKKLKDSIKDAKSELESFRSRKNEMNQEDFIAGEKHRVQTLNRKEIDYAESVADLNRAKRMAYEASPAIPALQPHLDRMGLGQYGTMGYLTSAGGIATMGGGMLGAIGALGQGYLTYQRFGSDAARSQAYERSLMGMEEMQAQQRIRSMYAASTQGNITAAALSNLGMGVAANEMGSAESQKIIEQRVFEQSRGYGAGTGALKGAMIGGGAGVGLAATLAMAGMGLTGTGVGALVGVPLLAAAGIMGYMGYKTATPTTVDTEKAKLQEEYTKKDLEYFDTVLGEGGRRFYADSKMTELQQRIMGISGSRSAVQGYLSEGIASVQDLAPMIKAMARRGQGLGSASFGVYGKRFGADSDMAREAMARFAAATSPADTMMAMNQLFATAGFQGMNTYAGRGVLADFASGQMANRAAGAIGFGDAGAFAAQSTSGFSGTFDSFESAQLGVQTAQVFQSQSENAESLQGTMLRSALASLGIVDPRLQTVLIKQGLEKPSTRAKIAKVMGISLDVVNKTLSSALGVVSAAADATFSEEGRRQAKAMGVDMQAFGASGGDMRYAESVAQSGQNFGDIRISAATSEVAGADAAAGVAGTKSFSDKLSEENAKISATIENNMKKIADKAGKDVMGVIMESVQKGFEEMSKSVNEATDKLLEKGITTRPEFTGTKPRQ